MPITRTRHKFNQPGVVTWWTGVFSSGGLLSYRTSAVLFRRNVQRFVELSLSCQARYRLIPGMTSWLSRLIKLFNWRSSGEPLYHNTHAAFLLLSLIHTLIKKNILSAHERSVKQFHSNLSFWMIIAQNTEVLWRKYVVKKWTMKRKGKKSCISTNVTLFSVKLLVM